jgi:hypothetical protein
MSPGAPLPPAWARTLAFATAIARCALGVTALVAPGLPLRPWVGAKDAAHPSSRLLARALGGRDLALGLGVILAFRNETPVRGWVEAGGLADAGDLAITAASFPRLPAAGRWMVAGAAGAGVLAARLAAPTVDRDPGDRSR